MTAELTQAEPDPVTAVAAVSETPAGASESVRRSWRRGLVAFAVTIASLALLLVAFAIAYDSLHAGRILPGVEVAGVSVGGLDRGQAEARLRGALADPNAGRLTVNFGDSVQTISYADIARDYDMTLMLGQRQDRLRRHPWWRIVFGLNHAL